MYDKWNARASRLVVAFLSVLIVYFTFKYALGIAFPFLVAWSIGATVAFFARVSERKFKGKKKYWSIFYISVFWGFVFLILFAFALKLGTQASELLSGIGENQAQINGKIESVVDQVTSLPSKIPLLEKISRGEIFGKTGEYIKKAAAGIIDTIVKQGGSFVAQNLGSFALKTPRALTSVLICVISSIYISLDYDKIKGYFSSLAKRYVSERTREMLGNVSSGIKEYLKAYFFVFLITFFELYAGLSVLGRKYALLIAFLVAVFDILPLFGVGAVLVPWGVILLARGSIGVGIGMLALFLVMTVVRQIVEPHLIGKHLGIHPLASLVSVYVGYMVFGFSGMLVAPFVALVIKGALEGSESGKKREKELKKKLDSKG